MLKGVGLREEWRHEARAFRPPREGRPLAVLRAVWNEPRPQAAQPGGVLIPWLTWLKIMSLASTFETVAQNYRGRSGEQAAAQRGRLPACSSVGVFPTLLPEARSWPLCSQRRVLTLITPVIRTQAFEHPRSRCPPRGAAPLARSEEGLKPASSRGSVFSLILSCVAVKCFNHDFVPCVS